MQSVANSSITIEEFEFNSFIFRVIRGKHSNHYYTWKTPVFNSLISGL